MNINGKDYLQVAYRLVWFREEHPTWSIHTEVISTDKESSVVKATITDDYYLDGRLMPRALAMAHKSETARGFPDHLEKAETGAIGRALAMCGYGTQFCADDLDEGARLADAPLSHKPAVFAEQPGPEDGVTPTDYRIPFGKWNKLSIEEVYDKFGKSDMMNYMAFIQDSAKKKGVEVKGDAADFISRCVKFLGTH
jgi:hypothetical protein